MTNPTKINLGCFQNKKGEHYVAECVIDSEKLVPLVQKAGASRTKKAKACYGAVTVTLKQV